MPNEIKLEISSLLKSCAQNISETWAREIEYLYKSSGTTIDELVQKSEVGIKIISNILEGSSFSSYENFIRKLVLEWIKSGGTLNELKNLKKRFIEICDDYFSTKVSIEKKEELLQFLDDFIVKELWLHAAPIYLEIFETEIYEKLRDLPDSNAALKRLLKLTARLGSITDAGDVWDELLHELREIFPSVHAGAVFLLENDRLTLKAIVGFEDFIPIKNSSSADFEFYEKILRRSGVTITASSTLDNPSKLVFYRHKIVGDNVSKEYPRFMLTFPLVAGNSLKGLLALYGFHKGIFFDDDELDLLDVLIANLKSALARADTFEDLKQRRRDSEALIDIERNITGLRNPSDLSGNFLKSVGNYLGNIRSAIYLLSSSSDELIPIALHNTLEKPGQSRLSPIYTYALERKAPIFLSSLKNNPILEGISPPSEIIKSNEQGALGIIPLTLGDEIIGLWAIATPEKAELVEARRFFLMLAASSLAYNLKNVLTHISMKEEHTRRDKEIHLAATLQQSLVPHYYRGLGYEVEVTLEAGGDLAGDFAFLDVSSGNEIFIAIGDVSGRGIAAGMSMMSTYGLMGELVKTTKSPALVLEKLNNRLREQFDKTVPPFHDESFVTCYLLVALPDGTVKYSKAGHMPPIIFRAESQTFDTMVARGMPLGIFSDSIYEEHNICVNSGDVILLYTDGITEARNEKGDEFGVERLKELVKRWGIYPPRILQRMIKYNLSRFVAPNSKGDDRTWIVIARERDGWHEFTLKPDDSKSKALKEIENIIEKTPIGKKSLTFSHAINESLTAAYKRKQTEIKIRLYADGENLHLVISDTDPALKGLDFPSFESPTHAIFPESRKALAVLKSDVDFIWHNSSSNELNIFKKFQKDELE